MMVLKQQMLIQLFDAGKKLKASVENQASSSEQTEPPGKKQKNHGYLQY